MKVEWEPDDIIPGRRYGRNGLNEVWLIGYLAEANAPRKFVSISMFDGLVTRALTCEELAAELTHAGYVPVEILDNSEVRCTTKRK